MAWEVAASATGDLVERQAQETVDTAVSDDELVNAALNVATMAPDRYAGFLQQVAENYDSDYAQRLHFAASNVLNEHARNTQAVEFMDELRQSEEANVQDAQAALDRLQARRGMSADEVEQAAAQYRDASGVPLRTTLLGVLPQARDDFLGEVAIAAEVDQKAESMRAFKASFFGPSTDINSGLKIRGERAGGDLPPAIMDADYNRHLVEQQVRREDAERSQRPSRESAEDIRRSVFGVGELDWKEGLTDDAGRPTSFRELASRDPDSEMSQQARARERDLRRITTITGGRRVG